MKYDGIVLYSDLDGTLLNDRRQLSDENLEALLGFVSQGGRFGVATGRMERTTLINFPALPINVPSIFFNGAIIYDVKAQEPVRSVFTPKGLEPVFLDILDRYPRASVEVNVRGKAYVFRENEITRVQLEREGLTGVEACWSEIPEGWLKVLVLDEHETLMRVKADLEAQKRSDIEIVFSESELLDILAKGVSKGEALSWLKRANKDNWRLVVAVGDNDNDEDMIRVADVGIAVGNARSAVKNAARHHLKHHNIPCIPQVLDLLEQYL